MFQRILVPIDFSDCAIRALQLAVEIAQTSSGHVTLLHVGVLALDVLPSIEPGAAIGPLSTQVGDSMRKELDHALHKIARDEIPAGMSHDVRTREGYPPETIADEAKGFDLVVMGTHGRTGLKRVLLGSVTDRVLRLSTVPVLVCH
jgi:nucleotide-binding universal stress UspA family protein